MAPNQKSVLSSLLLSEFYWSILLVSSHITFAFSTLDPFLFAVIQFLSGGIFLVCISRKHIQLSDFLFNGYSLIYGFSRLGTGIFFTAALVTIPASTATFLGILNVTIGMIALCLVTRTFPRKTAWPGHILIIAGFISLCTQLDGGLSNPAIWYMVGSEVCVVISTLVAEKHPMNQGDDVKERAYLTGTLLVTSGVIMLLFLACLHSVAKLKFISQYDLPGWMQNQGSLFSPELWLLGVVFGIVLRGPVVYFSLRAIQLAKSQVYLAFSALLPFMALALETILSWYTPLHIAAPDTIQISLGLIMTAGALWILLRQFHNN